MIGQCWTVIMTGCLGPSSGIGAFHPFWYLRKLWHLVRIRCHQTVQYLEIQEIIAGHAILHTSLAIIITLRGPSPTVHGPVDETLSPFTIVQLMEWLGMGICSISANYSPDNSLSNGIIILESFFTNLDILATKVVRKEKNPILGTSRGRGLKSIQHESGHQYSPTHSIPCLLMM
jgi:hypothetical protein